MFDHYSGYLIGMHAFGWLFWSMLIAVLIFLAVRSARTPFDSTAPKETAHDILKRRLAAGEISPEDYEQRKALLDRDR